MEQNPPPRKPGTFLPGHDPRRDKATRPKGVRNKIPDDIRRDCVEGLARHGFDGKGKDGFIGYIHFLAGRHPKQAARIVEKILPLTVKGDGLVSSSIRSVNIVSVPSGSFLSKEELAKYAPPSLRQIEQEIAHEHSDEPPQLEHAPEPVASPPEPLELIEPMPSGPELLELIERVQTLKEQLEREPSDKLFEDHEVETMFSRAGLRLPRKPSRDVT